MTRKGVRDEEGRGDVDDVEGQEANRWTKGKEEELQEEDEWEEAETWTTRKGRRQGGMEDDEVRGGRDMEDEEGQEEDESEETKRRREEETWRTRKGRSEVSLAGQSVL
ncbi:hypothetical protein CBR_g3910 [Chara braunii]|uniref:Uncharacterized protein n=1 Tax=Chara braunii TaxID=69332 RepID=A0A388KGP1_CHABU|nr:hypothetical protein CBR_g3910 [Chara braunii]|eukprot:GBG69211.1 hypothetical protein CBR_g3910 [Chara braunii]